MPASTPDHGLTQAPPAPGGTHGPRPFACLVALSRLLSRDLSLGDFAREACGVLREELGAAHAVMAYWEDGRWLLGGSKGAAVDAALQHAMEAGAPPDCLRPPAPGGAAARVYRPQDDCGGCPLRDVYPGLERLVVRLGEEGQPEGLLSLVAQPGLLDQCQRSGMMDAIAAHFGLALRRVHDREQARRASLELARLHAAIQQTPDTVVLTDTQGAILYANPAFEAVTGYRLSEVSGQNPRVLKSGIHDKDFYEAMWGTLLAGEVWSGRITNRRKDGSLYVEDATISPVDDKAGERIGYVAVKRDITERLELEARVQHGQKLEAVGVLAAGVAHEINNPLFGISGFAELIELEPGCPEGIREMAGKIVGETDRIARIVNSLLEFARPSAEGESTVDVRVLVDHTLTLLRPRLANIGASVQSRVEPGCQAFIGARSKVQQVLLNLLSNACDAVATRPPGPPGPRIDVVAEPAPGDAGSLRLVVRDNGPGIDQALADRLFVPFHTTKGPGKGTGLGLAVSRRLAIEMRGTLEHRPAPGGGAEFHLTLPRGRPTASAKGAQCS